MIRDNLHTFHLKLTTLSPVHIGTGEVYEPTNFVIDEGRLFEFDEVLFYQNLNENDKKRFNDTLDNWMGIIDFYRSKAKETKDIARFECDVSEKVQTDYTKLKNKDGSKNENQFQIAETFKNPNTHHPIIPGSSIKGMLDTVLGIYTPKVKSNTPRQKLIVSDTILLEGKTQIGYAYRRHKNPSKVAKKDLRQIVEIISNGSAFTISITSDRSFSEIQRNMNCYYAERKDNRYKEDNNSFIARVGKFSGKAYMVDDGKNVLNSDGRPVATHTLYENNEEFGWIKVELLHEDDYQKNILIPESIVSYRKRVLADIEGKSKGIKQIYQKTNVSVSLDVNVRIIEDYNKKLNIDLSRNIEPVNVLRFIDEHLAYKYDRMHIDTLAQKCNCTRRQIEIFAKDENIDIGNDDFLKLDIANIIKEYINA